MSGRGKEKLSPFLLSRLPGEGRGSKEIVVEVKVDRREEGLATLVVTGEAEQVEEVYRRVIKELRREVRAPGFRAGKVPES